MLSISLSSFNLAIFRFACANSCVSARDRVFSSDRGCRVLTSRLQLNGESAAQAIRSPRGGAAQTHQGPITTLVLVSMKMSRRSPRPGQGGVGAGDGDDAYGRPGSGGGGATSVGGAGGGGGSYDAGVNKILAAGVRTGNGEVMITDLASGSPLPAAPEPPSPAMVGTGLIGLAGLAAMRRRSKT